MTARSEFNGDVGQAVLGDVKEASRIHNNNILQVSMGAREEDKPITELQRRRISAKVKQVVQATGTPQLDVYTVILTELGAATIAELPRSRFRAAMEILDSWLNADRDEHGATAVPAPAPPAPVSVVVQRPGNAAPWFFAAAAIAITAWLFLDKTLTAQASTEHLCHHDGKAFSIGSAARMADGSVRHCVRDPDGAEPQWVVPTKPGAQRRR